jgi:hypothetical protein
MFHFWCPVPVQVRTETQTYRETYRESTICLNVKASHLESKNAILKANIAAVLIARRLLRYTGTGSAFLYCGALPEGIHKNHLSAQCAFERQGTVLV